MKNKNIHEQIAFHRRRINQAETAMAWGHSERSVNSGLKSLTEHTTKLQELELIAAGLTGVGVDQSVMSGGDSGLR